MSNLGKYQTLTTLAKEYGSPEKFINAVHNKGIRKGFAMGIIIGGLMTIKGNKKEK